MSSTSTNTAPQTEYPEHAKMVAIKAQSQAIGEFLEWLRSEQRLDLCKFDGGFYVCEECEERFAENRVSERGRKCPNCGERVFWQTEGYYPDRRSIEKLLADYYKIDLDKIESEKRRMIDGLRAIRQEP